MYSGEILTNSLSILEEVVPLRISIRIFCLENKMSFNIFLKWYKNIRNIKSRNIPVWGSFGSFLRKLLMIIDIFFKFYITKYQFCIIPIVEIKHKLITIFQQDVRYLARTVYLKLNTNKLFVNTPLDSIDYYSIKP